MDTIKLKDRLGGKVQELQRPAEAVPVSDTALTPVNSSYDPERRTDRRWHRRSLPLYGRCC